MTHDPREALKRELNDCQSAVQTIEDHRDPANETQNGNYRFYQGRVVSLKFAIESLTPANELRDEPEKFRRVYTSPTPAAGWDDNQLQLIIERALLDDEYFGNRAADEDQLEAQAHGSAALIVESLRREAPAPEGVSTPPAAGESKASVEARLRELLTTVRSMHGELGAKFDEISKYMPNDHMAQSAARARQKGLGLAIEPIERTLKTLSAVGDEAKKSEGGQTHPSHDIRGLDQSIFCTECNGVDAELNAPCPSDPTAERREIVARIIDPVVFAKYDAELAKDRRAENGKRWADVCYGEAIGRARSKADAILAALDGGAGA